MKPSDIQEISETCKGRRKASQPTSALFVSDAFRAETIADMLFVSFF